MALERPRWKGFSTQDSTIVLSAAGGTADLINLSDGPGIIKGGGFKVSSLAHVVTDYDLKLTIDGTVLFDFNLSLLDALSANSTTRPWTFTEATTELTFAFKENANLGFLSTVVLELENNNAGADTVTVSGGVDHHVGA